KDLPDGKKENANLALYTEAMRKVAAKNKIGFIDLFKPTLELFEKNKVTEKVPGKIEYYTINGFSLKENGDEMISQLISSALYKQAAPVMISNQAKFKQLVIEKDWFWRNDYRMLNGVHAYGRRWQPFGDFNYPQEIDKIRQMTADRDLAVWDAAEGKEFDLAAADAKTRKLDEVASNFSQPIKYLDKDEALSKFKMMDGFQIDQFASEEDFPDLAKPMQMSFDNKGRLWVAVMPSYPHYRPGDEMPNDKILILEDTDGDGHADKQTVFAEGLSLPIGFELAPEGVYVSQEPNLVLLRDTDGDGKADSSEMILQGFDTHDTHHAIHAFCADASGAIYMGEGTFLHTEVETPYGPRRGTGAGIWRFDPKTYRLERYIQTEFYNPWGIAFNDWQLSVIADASSGANWWGLPISQKMLFDQNAEQLGELFQKRSRPTAGAEFVSSRNFPDEMQGAFMMNNAIGFLGTSMHKIGEANGGLEGSLIGDLITSSDPNFRPCDLEFAPDGSLYVIDWHNALIGHMQHSARDPNRDHTHGRIYRITYKSRPLVKPAKIAGAPIGDLLELLKEPEYRTRYRARRELRGHPAEDVIPAVKAWAAKLDPADPRYEHHLSEALWATWAQNQIDHDLLVKCLNAKAHEARTAAVDVIRHDWRKIPDHEALLMKAAADPEPMVRLGAVVAASWIDDMSGARVFLETLKMPVTKWMPGAMKGAYATLQRDIDQLKAAGKLDLTGNPKAADLLAGKLKLEPENVPAPEAEPASLKPEELALWRAGKAVFHREAHCATCHQADGNGLSPAYPPLAGSEWAQGNEERLIKVALKGIWGTITVKGTTWDTSKGVPPMTPFGPILNDEEMASVLTYVRNSFGNSAPAVSPETVKRVREATKDKATFYTPDELLKEHPFPDKK
ncbi:MAG: dehydrogenase, partial [Akkermansiaceae bacterium]|nr:dehydrogenase [Akkermansiaceae bacterium]